MEHDEIAARLKLAIDRESAAHALSADAWPRIERRLRLRSVRIAAAVAAAVAVTAAAAALSPLAWRAIHDQATAGGQHRAARLALAGRTHLARAITKVAAGYGAVWVIGLGVVYRVDQATGAKVAAIPAPGAGELSGIAAGAGAVWVTTTEPACGLYRIDPRRDRVDSFVPLPPTPTGVTVAGGRVWVVEPRQGPGVVLRIDPGTGAVLGTPVRVGTGPGRIVAGFGSLWVTNSDGSVSQISQATGIVTRTLRDVHNIVAAGAGSLWATAGRGIERVDPASGLVTSVVRVRHAVAVAFWRHAAWVASDPPGTITRADLRSDRVAGRAVPAGSTPVYLAAGPTGLWVSDADTGDLLHLASRR